MSWVGGGMHIKAFVVMMRRGCVARDCDIPNCLVVGDSEFPWGIAPRYGVAYEIVYQIGVGMMRAVDALLWVSHRETMWADAYVCCI